MKDLQYHEKLYEDNIRSSSENDMLDEPSKRLKVDYFHNTRTIYTGKQCFTNSG